MMEKKLILIFMIFVVSVQPAFATDISLSANVTDIGSPSINSFSLAKYSFQLNEKLNLTINASDTSDRTISMVWATFRYPDNSKRNYTTFLSSGTNQSGIFIVQFNSTGTIGTYAVTNIYANDSASNISSNTSALIFTVSITPSGASYSGGSSAAIEPEEASEEKTPSVPSQPSTSPEKCIEDWSCSDWSECTDGIRARVCTDANDCSTAENGPLESESCATPEESEDQVPLGIPLGAMPIAIILMGAAVLYVALKKRKLKQTKNRKHFKKVK